MIAVYLFFRNFAAAVEVDAALITASCAGMIGYARAASMDMALAAAFSWGCWRGGPGARAGREGYLAGFLYADGVGDAGQRTGCTVSGASSWLCFRYGWRPADSADSLASRHCCSARSGCHGTWRSRCEIPQFFREFILEHNLARFSAIFIIIRQPFWYYLPVTALALVPWTALSAVALVESLGVVGGTKIAGG